MTGTVMKSDTMVQNTSTSTDPTSTTGQSKPLEYLSVFDGVRALAIIWVILYHHGYFVGYQTVEMATKNREAYITIFHNADHWGSMLWRNGFNAVEILFALTGFLLARPFITKAVASTMARSTTQLDTTNSSESIGKSITNGQVDGEKKNSSTNDKQVQQQQYQEKEEEEQIITPPKNFFQYFIPRMARLYPLYFLLLVASAIWRWNMYPNWKFYEFPMSLFGLGNFLQWGGFVGWAWSLCIQIQFTVVLYFIVKYSKNLKNFMRINITWWLFVLLIYRTVGWVTRFGPLLHSPQNLADNKGYAPYAFYTKSDFAILDELFRHFYANSILRSPALIAGVIACYLHYNQQNISIIQKIQKLNIIIKSTLLIIGMWGFLIFTQTDSTGIDPDGFWTIFVATGSILQNIFVIVTFFGLLNSWCPPITTFMSLTIWKNIAYISYAAYLFHMPILKTLSMAFYPNPATDLITRKDFYTFVFISHCILIVTAYLATRYIEDPVRNKLCAWARDVGQTTKPTNTIVNDTKKVD